jgi:predicted GNAT family acetyltransferase
MAELEIAHETNDSGGAWIIEQDGRRVGELAYTTKDPRTIVLTHTEVGPELRGQGAGARLVEAAVGWARAHGRTIVAECPFARATLDKRPDLQDVLAR